MAALEEQEHAPPTQPLIAQTLNPMARPTMTCPQCGAAVPDVAGPVHRYVPSAPGCWELFAQIQADEALRFGYPLVHRVVVDAYMAQHPGDGHDRRDRQSVFVHLAGLYAVLEQHLLPAQATNLLRRVLEDREEFPVLARDDGPGELTVVHLVGALDLADYERRALAWARAVWQAWAQHHALIREAVTSLLD
jgi:hypothetical protein